MTYMTDFEIKKKILGTFKLMKVRNILLTNMNITSSVIYQTENNLNMKENFRRITSNEMSRSLEPLTLYNQVGTRE